MSLLEVARILGARRETVRAHRLGSALCKIGRQPQRAPDGPTVYCERHRPEQTTLHRLVQQHAATFLAQAEVGGDLSQFVKDGFDAFLECGILAHGFLRPRRGDCGHDKLPAQGPDSAR